MVRRLGAMVVAVALVVAAVAVRRALDGESLLTDSDPIVCDSLIVDACLEAFGGREVRGEHPGVTLGRLSAAAAPEPFVWVTAEAWFGMGQSELSRLSRPSDRLGDPDRLARSTQVAVVLAAGADGRCPQVTWTCVADLENLDVAAPPVATTVGLLARAEAAAAANGSGQFSLVDLRRLDPGWAELENAAGILATRPGQLDVAFADAASAATITRTVEVAVPTDSRAAITVVAVGAGGGRNDLDLDGLDRALASRGWGTDATVAASPSDPISINGLLAVWAG